MLKGVNPSSYTGLEIAVIGMACRFPGAENPSKFWELLINGGESVCQIPDAELLKSGVDPETLNRPDYVKTGCYLDGKEFFDSVFFDYLDSEARIMDPQMRIIHECIWEALEDSGCDPDNYHGLIGLFVGAGSNYNWYSLALLDNQKSHVDELSAQHLSNKDFLATKVSYKLNLKGPSISLQTACSTSLVAVHLACRSLLTGECSTAVAGGVTVLSTPKTGYLYSEGMILSPDGHCRAFDIDAKGTIFGEGAGIVVLKRLKNALADKNNIYAIIKGSAINNDGARKIGYTAPSIDGQVEVVKMAQKMAKIESDSISYIEAHGTGTALGDPIEVEALNTVFGNSGTKFCGLGSVKPNIGHLDTAAGVASFIKTVLALNHRTIPPSINFSKPNPKINFNNSPFYVVNQVKEWVSHGGPLRAGVSSLGIGGTNAHVILEEAPAVESQPSSRPYQLMLFSAKTREAFGRVTSNMKNYLENNPGPDIADIAYTLANGRKHLPHRKFAVCKDRQHAIGLLNTLNEGKIVNLTNPRVVFMLPGQGSQYNDMGRELYRTESLFREEMDKFFAVAFKVMKTNLSQSHSAEENIYSIINNPQNARIALFAIEYSLAKFLIRLNIKPDLMIGHGLGEYVAACISGVFTLEDTLSLILVQESLVNDLPRGAMLSVSLSQHDIQPVLLQFGLSLAAINSPESCVISGSIEAIAAAESKLKMDQVACQKLHTSYAYHSAVTRSIIPQFRLELNKINYNLPRIPYLSNLTGDYIKADDINPDYWCRHLYSPVKFSDQAKVALKNGENIFIEVGPGRTLSALIRQNIPPQNNVNNNKIINIIRDVDEDIYDQACFLNSLGEAWSSGLKIDWNKFYEHENRRLIHLPTYPFEKIPYTATGDPLRIYSENVGIKPTRKRLDIQDWWYLPSWESRPLLPAESHPVKKTNLVFGGAPELVDKLTGILKQDSQDVIKVYQGPEWQKISAGSYVINPSEAKDISNLIENLNSSGLFPDRLIFMANVYTNTVKLSVSKLHHQIKIGFFPLIRLIQEMIKSNALAGKEIIVVTSDLHNITGNEQILPEKSIPLGFLKVLSQEYPSVKSYGIDVSLTDNSESIAESILHEVKNNRTEKLVAYRNRKRWVQHFISIPADASVTIPRPIIRGGTYLIIGGLGRLGFLIAKNLLLKYECNVVLFGRTDFTRNIGSENSVDNDYLEKKHRLNELESIARNNIIYFSGDSGSQKDIENCIQVAPQKFNKINGVIYAAGILKGESISGISSLSEDAFNKQFESKVDGLLVLHRALRKARLDFCVVFSSLSSILGGLGYGAYAAANTFVDYFIQSISNMGWTAVDLDGVRFSQTPSPKQENDVYYIGEKEIFTALEKITAYTGFPQVIVSSGDLNARLKAWVNQEKVKDSGTDSVRNVSKERPHLSAAFKAPVTAIEKDLSKIWSDFFNIKEIGITDNFYELGGDSLKAMMLSKSIFDKLAVEIPLAEFFNRPCVEQLADYIDNMQKSKSVDKTAIKAISYFDASDEGVVKALYRQDTNIEAIYPLSYMQYTALNHNLMYSNSAGNIQVVTCILNDVNIEKFQSACTHIIMTHPILRTEFKWRKLNAPVQVVYKTVLTPFRLLDWTQIPEGQQEEKLKEHVEEVRKSKLKKAPLMDISLIRLNDRQHRLVWCFPNMLFDAWSLNIILNDLSAAYNTRTQISARKTYAFTDYIEWLYQQDTGAAESFWKNEFEGWNCPPINQGNKVGGTGGFPADSYFTLTEEEKVAIREFARRHQLSLNTIVTGCWTKLQAKILNTNDFIIGMLTSGRPLALEGIESIAGLFTNILPLRVVIPDSNFSLPWLAGIQEKIYKCKTFEYASLQQISKWCAIPYTVLQQAIYARTLVYVDYPSGESTPNEQFTSYSSYSGLVSPIRFITGPDLDMCLRYDKSLYTESEISSMQDEIKSFLLDLLFTENSSPVETRNNRLT